MLSQYLPSTSCSWHQAVQDHCPGVQVTYCYIHTFNCPLPGHVICTTYLMRTTNSFRLQQVASPSAFNNRILPNRFGQSRSWNLRLKVSGHVIELHSSDVVLIYSLVLYIPVFSADQDLIFSTSKLHPDHTSSFMSALPYHGYLRFHSSTRGSPDCSIPVAHRLFYLVRFRTYRK